MGVIRLVGPRLEVTVAPEVGGEIRSVRERAGGREVLFRAPWQPDPEVDRSASPDDWVHGWVGGWQLLFPNAGVEAVVGGERHPFHGAASTAPWDVVAATAAEVELRFRGGDLEVRRTCRLDGRVLRVATAVQTVGPASAVFVATEHLILGGSLLEGDPRVTLSGGRVWPMSDDGLPDVPRDAARPWPDGYDRPGRPGSRFAAIVDVDRRLAVVDGGHGLRVAVRWSASYPSLW